VGVQAQTDSGIGVCATSSTSTAVYGTATSPCATNYGVRGVSFSKKGHGVCGTAKLAGGIALRGLACDVCATPIVARGACCQVANLQHWQRGCTIESVVNGIGWFGIKTTTPLAPLSVVGSAAIVGSLSVCCCVTCGVVIEGKSGAAGARGVFGYNNSTSGTTYGVFGQANSPCGVGVHAEAIAKGGIALRGFAGGACSIPIVAQGATTQGANLQQWQKGSTILDVVNKCGWLGVGDSSPSTPLYIAGSSPLVGTIKSKATSGDRSSLVQFANGDSTAVDWNLGVAGLCNSIKVPDGYFYVQHSTSCTPALSVNKCNNHVGIGVANPCRVLCVNGRIHTNCGMGLGTQTINTTLAINGSLSIKSRQVSSAATLSLSDYVVLANAASAAFTITLPAVSSTAGACNGMMLFVKKIDSSSNAVTIAASGTDTIEGSASAILKKQYDSLQLVSNNSGGTHEWFILAAAKCGVYVT
jgi:hypothetical protein